MICTAIYCISLQRLAGFSVRTDLVRIVNYTSFGDVLIWRLGHALASITSSRTKYEKHLNAFASKKDAISDLTSQLARQEDQLQQLGDIQRIEQYNKKTMKILEENEQMEILNWTSQVQYQRHYTQSRKKALQGTGGWLFTHPKYLQWKQSSTSEILWLHGIPGSGKSTLLYVNNETPPRTVRSTGSQLIYR